MQIEQVEQRLRDAYAATASIGFPDRVATDSLRQPPGRRGSRGRLPVLAAAAVIATITVAIGLTDALHPGHPTATSPGTTGAPNATTAGSAPAPLASDATPTVGVIYSYRLFVHCGVQIIAVGGRAWAPVAPVPVYPGPRPGPDGITTDDGYAQGTLTLVDSDTLRFDATDAIAAFVVTFHPYTQIMTLPACD
jgi:hypothetical protein